MAGRCQSLPGVCFRRSGRIIIPLTVREIRDEQLARKLA